MRTNSGSGNVYSLEANRGVKANKGWGHVVWSGRGRGAGLGSGLGGARSWPGAWFVPRLSLSMTEELVGMRSWWGMVWPGAGLGR